MEVEVSQSEVEGLGSRTLEEQFVDWVSTLSVLDQQLLRDCVEAPALPRHVVDLFRYSPVFVEEWLECDPPYSFYPEALLRALGQT